jgi:hypothetical protein
VVHSPPSVPLETCLREQNTAKGKYVRILYSNANESGFWLPYFCGC